MRNQMFWSFESQFWFWISREDQKDW
jgi:hypothetical protein